MASTTHPSDLDRETAKPASSVPAAVKGGSAFTFRPVLVDAVLCAVVAAVAAYCAWTVLHPFGNELYSNFKYNYLHFGPAIQIAAGNGAVQLPEKGVIPELDAFLEGRAPGFDTALLPDSPGKGSDLDPWQATHIYLMHSIAMVYRLVGVNRWSIHVLCGFLHAACAVILFGIFRLGMGRSLSLAGGLLIASSSVYLSMCPALRDFGKAPWILAVILVLGILIRFRHNGKWLLAYAALLGALMGIGYGFRQDVIICLVPALVVVLVLARVDAPGPVYWRMGAAAAMVLLLAALSYPVLKGMRPEGGAVASHTLTQGLAKQNEETMGFGNASYEFNYTEQDFMCIALAQSYAGRNISEDLIVNDYTETYGRVGTQMYMDVFSLCPADQFSRGLAAIAAAPRLLTSSWDAHPNYPNPEFDPLDRFEKLHAPISGTLVRIAFLCTILGFLFIAVYDLRLALGVAFLLAFFGAYPSLLYVYRHAFYLSFTPYWFAGLCLSILGQGVRHAVTRRKVGGVSAGGRSAITVRDIGRGLAFVSAGALVILGSLSVMLLIQRTKLERLAGRYDDAQFEALTVEQEKGEDGVLFSLPKSISEMQGRTGLPTGRSASEYIMARFCGNRQAISARITYDERDVVDFSQNVVIPPGDGVRFFFPVIEGSWCDQRTRFRGLLVQGGAEKYLEGLYRVTDAKSFRLWPFIMMPDRDEEFIWSKKGPMEKTLLGLRVELLSGFGWSRAKAIDGYLRLMRRYPEHLPYTRRAFGLAIAGGRFEEVTRVWNTVIANDPQPSEEAASSLGSLNDHGVFTAANLGSLRRAFKDLWTPPTQSATSGQQALLLAHGMNLAREGKSAAARAVFQTIVETSNNSDYVAHEALSDHYMETEDFEGMEEAWRAVVQARPGHVAAHFWLGLALERQGNLDSAISDYERALVLEPRMRRTKQALTRSLQTKAAVLFESGEIDAAQRLARRARTMWAMPPGPSTMEIQALIRMGRVTEAKATIREKIESTPHDYSAYDSLSGLYVAAGDVKGLKAEWQTMAREHPDWALAHLSLGLALERQDDLAGAIAAYRRALSLEPEAAGTKDALARAFKAKIGVQSDANALRECEKKWRTATDANPEDSLAHFSLGVVLEKLGDLHGATAAYEKALTLSSGWQSAKRALAQAYHAKARSLTESSAEEEALLLFKRSRKVWSADPGPSLEEAEAMVKGEQTEDGKAAYREIIERTPNGYGAYDALSEVYVSAGDLNGLEKEWRTAVQGHPDRTLAHFSLGLALERQDDLDGAIAAYEKALQFDPQGDGTRQALGRALYDKAQSLEVDGKMNEFADVQQKLQSLGLAPAPVGEGPGGDTTDQ